jgi:hypothetical protein
MTVTNFVHWEVACLYTPKEVIDKNLIPAGERPLNRNFVTDILLYATVLVFSAWIFAALVVSPTLVGFFPVVLVLLVVLPMLILVLPLQMVSILLSVIYQKSDANDEDMGVKLKKDSTSGVEELLRKEPLLLLKIGLMQAFTTMMLLAWFGDVYYGAIHGHRQGKQLRPMLHIS